MNLKKVNGGRGPWRLPDRRVSAAYLTGGSGRPLRSCTRDESKQCVGTRKGGSRKKEQQVPRGGQELVHWKLTPQDAQCGWSGVWEGSQQECGTGPDHGGPCNHGSWRGWNGNLIRRLSYLHKVIQAKSKEEIFLKKVVMKEGSMTAFRWATREWKNSSKVRKPREDDVWRRRKS